MKKPQGLAERRGDSFLLDTNAFSVDSGIGIERRIRIGIDGRKRVEERIGRFDNKESGDNTPESVVNLGESVRARQIEIQRLRHLP